MSEPRFLVCPGMVRAQHDGDWHYVGVAELVRLYELRPGEYLVDDGRLGVFSDDLLVLAPRYDGNYGRPVDG